MAQFAELLSSGGFASAVTYYTDHYPGLEENARIVLSITLEGNLTTEAIVDTGAPWVVIDPELADELGLDNAYEPERTLNIRGVNYAGSLHRIGICLQAENISESNPEIIATAFVPMLSAGEQWGLPNFIGLDGFLSRIRFAIDPEDNAFYYNPI